jgi:hypothetical protein
LVVDHIKLNEDCTSDINVITLNGHKLRLNDFDMRLNHINLIEYENIVSHKIE